MSDVKTTAGRAALRRISTLHGNGRKITCTDGLAWWDVDLISLLDAADAAERRLTPELLAPYYRRDPALIAELCDEVIDRSGALLGHVRAAAAEVKGEDHE
jgi:hypothetical protein